MATEKKVIEMLLFIKNTYGQYTREMNVDALIDTWMLLLKDYPDNAVEVAFLKCLEHCERPPLPAHIIKELKSMIDSLEPTDEELWSVYTDALNKTYKQLGYLQYPLLGETSADTHARIDKIYSELPEKLKHYIGSKGELMRMARDYTDDDLKFEKNRFLKMMPKMKQREEASKIMLLLGEEFKMIEG